MTDNLIHRLESAEGPSRELDGLIHAAIGRVERGFNVHKLSPSLPHYTASLDAAVSLVPEGWRWAMQNLEDQTGQTDTDFYYAHLEHKKELYKYGRQDGKGATPALALCIAALKAREAAKEKPPAEAEGKSQGGREQLGFVRD